MDAGRDDSWVDSNRTRAHGVPPALLEALSLSTALCRVPALVAVAPNAETTAGAWTVHTLGTAGESVELSSHRERIIDLARRACESTPGGGIVEQAEWAALPWSLDGRYGAVVLGKRAGSATDPAVLGAARGAIGGLLHAASESRALDALGEGMLCADDRGVISVATERAATLLGIARGRIEGRTLDAVLGEACGVLIAFGQLELAEQINLRTSTRDNEQVALCATRRLAPDGSPDGVIVRIAPGSAVAPIARRRDRQVAAIRHEIRAPLTVLRGVTSMLREEPDMPLGDRMTFLASLERETGRVITMVEDLLTRARLGAGPELDRRSPVDLATWARNLVKEYREWCRGHEHTIELSAPQTAVMVLADRPLLDSLARAVLGHIFKAAQPGTRVTFTVATEGAERALLRWVDDAPAIPEEEARQVFTSFRRSTSTGKYAPGGGVGLPIAKGVADAHGWGMGYERDAKGHNVIWARLPLQKI